ncbi:uncharacterized protein LOC116416599 [Nasonia vitripennis]|uniref:Uncharacterized protein n=1 Tax=Nasonia vitripennis TaxID=7425 RepID=A0A7M7Q600_NASVI|nr:uncharacterized protein LOC116416599 [Nasonia vitripennis]
MIDVGDDWADVEITRFIKSKDDYKECVEAIKRNTTELPSDPEKLKSSRSIRAKRKTVHDETNESTPAKKPKGKANVSRPIQEFFDAHDETSSGEESTTMKKSNRNKGSDDEIDNSSAASS